MHELDYRNSATRVTNPKDDCDNGEHRGDDNHYRTNSGSSSDRGVRLIEIKNYIWLVMLLLSGLG